ncbi:MAG: glycerate kinase [Gemmatimonadota bacterium]|nr:MAG: glycerate kinase [Gemmatimonadota bacterium]
MTGNAVKTVLVAPTAFKGTLGPTAVTGAMSAGVTAVWPTVRVVERPLSDGGNGLLEACRRVLGGTLVRHEVCGPLGEPVRARLLQAGERAVIESAEACGLHLIPPTRRAPLLATTRGVGELLRIAVEAGASQIVLGLGGSGTVDGGTGMARALGWRFEDEVGAPLAEGGGSLTELHRVHPPARPLGASVTALCDVENPLLGAEGAARVYGPQKGAGPLEVERLEAGLASLAQALEAQLGLQVAGLPGAGAAGGLGAGARAFLEAELASGAEWMIEQTGLRELLASADLVVTGEGRFDVQSGMGKLTGRVVTIARAAGVPVLLVCARVDGPVPDGVRAAHSDGRLLDEEGLTRLTRDACRGLAQQDRL